MIYLYLMQMLAYEENCLLILVKACLLSEWSVDGRMYLHASSHRIYFLTVAFDFWFKD